MLTLGDLLKLTDPKVARQSIRYRVDLFKDIDGKDGKHHVIGVVLGGDKPRKASIETADKKVSMSSRVLVYCSCQFFIYNLEIPLAASGSAKILNARATAPNKTNPTMKPGLCPHLVQLARLAMSADTTRKQAEKKSVKISNKLKE